MASISSVPLTFAEFAILALLLSILLAISTAEVLVPVLLKEKLADEKETDLRKASMAAFFGLFLTILLGFATQLSKNHLDDDITGVVPLAAIGSWWWFHLRGSQVANEAFLQELLDSQYKQALLKAVNGSDSSISRRRLYENSCLELQNDGTWLGLTLRLRHLLLRSGTPGSQLVNLIMLSEERYTKLLDEMLKQQREWLLRYPRLAEPM